MPRHVAFYSWQSDRPNRTNRGLIQTALEKAADTISRDEALDVEAVVERDTAGLSGSPDIATTIFGRIDLADAFVADVTLVTIDGASRPSPNPNVLLELGYALSSLGWEKVILVMNGSFGPPEQLPFDLRSRRVICFDAPDGDGEPEQEVRRKAKASLQTQLERALRDIIEERRSSTAGEPISPIGHVERAMTAIEDRRPDRGPQVARASDWLIGELDVVAPDLSGPEWRDDDLVRAIDDSSSIVATFARLARRAVEMRDEESFNSLHEAIAKAAARQYVTPGLGRTWREPEFDFWRFITHELFVVAVGAAVREKQFELALGFVRRPVVVLNGSIPNGVLDMDDLSQHVQTLVHRNKKLEHPFITLHGELLKERYAKAPLKEAMEFADFVGGDIFVLLATELISSGDEEFPAWSAHSLLYASQVPPRFLRDAIQRAEAERLATLFELSLDDFRKRLMESLIKGRAIYGRIFFTRQPLLGFEPSLIGAR